MQKVPKKTTAQYAFIQFIHNCTLCSTLAFSKTFLQARGFSDSEVGVILAIAGVLGIIVNPLIASFSDKHSEIPMKSISGVLLLSSAVGALLLIVLPNLFIPTAVLTMILYTLSRMQGTFLTSLAMEHVYAGKDLNFSLCRGFGSIGYAVMAAVMGYGVELLGSWMIMAVILIGGVLDAVLIFTFPRPADDRDSVKGRNDNSTEQEAIGLFRFAMNNFRFILVVFAVILIYASHQFINTYTINIVESLGCTSKEMGIGTAIAAVVELPGMAIVPWMRKKFGNSGALLELAAVTFIVKSLMTAFAPNIYVFYAAQVLQFFGFATIIPAGVFFVNEHINEANKVKGQSVFDMSLVISGILFNLLGGLFYEHTDVKTTLLIGTGISIFGTVLLFIILAGYKNKDRKA